MPLKENINIAKAYQDFMRYEGVPESLPRDLAPEQKIDELLNINQKMMVKDTLSEAGHSTQNPVKQGGVRILNRQPAQSLIELVSSQRHGHGYTIILQMLTIIVHPES